MTKSAPPRFAWLVLVVVAAGLTPPAFAQDSPRIVGTVQPARGLTGVAAIDRKAKKRVVGKIVDAASGRFAVAGLTLGRRYDLQLDFGPQRRLEGINLKVPRSDYVEEQPLVAEDVKVIREKVLRLNKFEDVVEILVIQGNIQHAAILINKLRTRPFFGSKPGEIIWRAELWHFERPEETWLKRRDELFTVLYRQRMPKRRYVQKSVTFDAGLGGLEVSSKRPRVDTGRIVAPSTKVGVRLRKVKSAGKVDGEDARRERK
ncbi:MAG: hypothetical protein VB859_03035 [Planctomycetaceae bacterium]